jgi:site-specific DNA-cytosine methylase
LDRCNLFSNALEKFDITKINQMRILIACEFSGIVRDAFIKRGHDAISCDIQDSELPGPHYKGRLEDFIGSGREWDMIIGFPPCTDLAVSGAHTFKKKIADGRQQFAINFFMMIANRDCKRIAIENPVGIMSTQWKKSSQIIQPYNFGHPESKKTCLWLKGLPCLNATNILKLPECGYWNNQTPSGQNKLGPGINRAKDRGRTYSGIAEAMADQWNFSI